MKNKRYLAFCGDIYYPRGGMDDYIGSFDTIKDAVIEINRHIDDKHGYYDIFEERLKYSFCHVFDTATWTKVVDGYEILKYK